MPSVFSREYLQGLKKKTRDFEMKSLIESTVVEHVLNAAQMGQTNYFWPVGKVSNKLHSIYGTPVQLPSPYPLEDLVQMLEQIFPGVTCTIENGDGLKGIRMDWSL